MSHCRILFFLFLFICDIGYGSLDELTDQMIGAAQQLNRLGLFPATSGNLSARLEDDLFVITVSGKHKGKLKSEDLIVIGADGISLNPSKKPSAETALHLLIYRLYPEAAAVIHTHSLDGTVLSLLLKDQDVFVTEGYEIHKAFPGMKTHDSYLELPIFENSQDYEALSIQIAEVFQDRPQVYGFFLRGHGLYTWGKDVEEAEIRTEAFEFLFRSELKKLQLQDVL